jgi:hypothetical protein
LYVTNDRRWKLTRNYAFPEIPKTMF